MNWCNLRPLDLSKPRPPSISPWPLCSANVHDISANSKHVAFIILYHLCEYRSFKIETTFKKFNFASPIFFNLERSRVLVISWPLSFSFGFVSYFFKNSCSPGFYIKAIFKNCTKVVQKHLRWSFFSKVPGRDLSKKGLHQRLFSMNFVKCIASSNTFL